MELLMKDGSGELQVNNYVLNFNYEETDEEIKIYFEKDLDNPILQIVVLEKKLRDLDFNNIEIVVKRKLKKIAKYMLDSTYLLKSGDREKYVFFKSLSQKKAIRLSLTEKCNYKCFFCHEEGLDMTTNRESANFTEMCNLLLKMKELNYEDLTFTGGEPLVAMNDLLRYLDFMEEHEYTPDITIVTNGYLINEKLINRIKRYKGDFKFNFSMHSVDKESYYDIVRPANQDKNAFDVVMKNIKLIRDNNIKLKMNFVLLKGLNTSKEYIKRILDFAEENGVYCVKFLELLITEKLTEKSNYFYKLNSVISDLGEDIHLDTVTYRRSEYIYKDKLRVEFQKITCANGCNLCPLNREINITPQMSYYPCFIRNSEKIDINCDNIQESLKKGDEIIEEFMTLYKDKSPVIIKNVDNESKKVEYAYKSRYSIEEIKKIMKKNEFKLNRQRIFGDYFYLPKKVENDYYNFKKILKLTINGYENHYREVVQEREFSSIEKSITVHFLTEGREINNKEKYDAFLSHLDFEETYQLNWVVEFYDKQDEMISIGINENTKSVYLISNKKVDEKLINMLNLQLLEEDYYLDIVKTLKTTESE